MNEKLTKTLDRGCLLCGQDDADWLLDKASKSFVRCRSCGLIYQNPRSTPEQDHAYYELGYYESFGDQNIQILQSRLSLYEDFLSSWIRGCPKGRLLDVGCGFGDFLRKVKREGWEVWGIEPSREASRQAQALLGENVLQRSVETADFPENYFDLITLWNVIDYLSDPLEALRKIRRWLSPRGVLFIRTPNASFHLAAFRIYERFGGLLARGGWVKEPSVFQRSNFNISNLRWLLQAAGFQRVWIENGRLTAGDAYGVFSKPKMMERAKKGVCGFAQFVALFSGNRCLVGPNLVARAAKEIAPAEFTPRTSSVRLILKSSALHLLAILGYLGGLPLWFRLLGKDREIQILRYHGVNERSRSDLDIRESEFRRQIDFLARHYSVISLEEAVRRLKRRERFPRRTVVITFDDGYENNYTAAYPILKHFRLSATVFLLTAGEGNERRLTQLLDGEPHQSGLLAWDQVREMAQGGITFGSHGQTHERLAELTTEKVEEEVLLSKEKIENKSGLPVRFFSYPYGGSDDFDERIKEGVRRGGYEAAFSALFGSNGTRADLFALKRIGIEASDSLWTFRAKLNGALGLLGFFELPLIRLILRQLDLIFFKVNPPVLKRKPPLLLVSVDFPPHTDGISTISRELSRRIALRGQKVSVIGPQDKGDREFDALQPYRVFRVAGYEWGYFRFFPLLIQMPWIVLRYGIRKVFAMNIAYGGTLSWMLSHGVALEYLIFAHGYEFEKVKNIPILRRLYRDIYRRAKGIVANSEVTRERLIRFGAPSEKIKVLHPAVDVNLYQPLQVPQGYLDKHQLQGRRILLTVGRLIERKGHDQVLRALPKIIENFSDVLYCMVGIGPHEGKLRAEVKRLNLERHVRFMGKIPDQELVFLYNACQVFVMPSREILEGGHIEGFGIVYLEANACGKPAIGGRSGGIAEAIRDGETGFLVDPNRPDEIAEKVIFLLSHPEKAEAMGKEGFRWVREAFHWNRYVEQAFEFLSGSPLP